MLRCRTILLLVILMWLPSCSMVGDDSTVQAISGSTSHWNSTSAHGPVNSNATNSATVAAAAEPTATIRATGLVHGSTEPHSAGTSATDPHDPVKYKPVTGKPAPKKSVHQPGPAPVPSDSTTSDSDPDQESASPSESEIGRPVARTASMAIPTGRADTSILLLEKTVPSEAQVGEAFKYRLRVTNLTETLVHDVKLTDLLAGLEIVMSNPPADVSTIDEVTWNLGFLDAAEVREIEVTARARHPGSMLTSSVLRYDQVLSMTTEIVQPVLGLRVEGPTEQYLCELLEYRFTLTNSGNGAARNVLLSAELPSGLTTQDGAREIRVLTDVIPAGESHEIPVTLAARSGGTYTVEARVIGAGDLAFDAAPFTTQVIEPILAVQLDGPGRGLADRPLLYEITVRNTGRVRAPDVQVEHQLPDWSSVLKTSEGGHVADGRITWSLGGMEPNAVRKLEVMLSRSIEGEAVYKVVASGYSARDVVDRVHTTFQGVPDVQLEVIDSDDPVGRGKGTTYTITATNYGSAADYDVRVLGSWESKWRYESCSGPTEGTYEDGAVTFEPLATLAAKEKAVWKVHLKGRGTGDSTFKVIMTTREKARPIEQGEATILYR